MGEFLKQSNDIVENSAQLLDDILSSNFNQFLQGLGQPILVRYWNLNDTYSTADNGTGTIDSEIGPDSPNRYNRIENLPLYGALANVIPNLVENDNLLDLELESEGVILPDTIRPSTFDHYEFLFGPNKERSLLFRVNNVSFSTIKSNGYYKIECHLIDIDNSNHYRERLNGQVKKKFKVNLDTIGTNDKCIIESEHFDFIRKIDNIIEDVLNQYIDLFYDERYNAVVYHGILANDYLTYDPWLTKFLVQNNIFSSKKENPIMLVNYDEGYGFRQTYNMTLFHAIELRSLKYYKPLRYTPASFRKTNTNPFNYYGEEIAFKLDVYPQEPTKYSENIYMNLLILNNINRNEKTPILNEFDCLMVDFFNMKNLSNCINGELLEVLKTFVIEYSEYWFQFAPILIYILKAIKTDVNNSYS